MAPYAPIEPFFVFDDTSLQLVLYEADLETRVADRLTLRTSYLRADEQDGTDTEILLVNLGVRF